MNQTPFVPGSSNSPIFDTQNNANSNNKVSSKSPVDMKITQVQKRTWAARIFYPKFLKNLVNRIIASFSRSKPKPKEEPTLFNKSSPPKDWRENVLEAYKKRQMTNDNARSNEINKQIAQAKKEIKPGKVETKTQEEIEEIVLAAKAVKAESKSFETPPSQKEIEEPVNTPSVNEPSIEEILETEITGTTIIPPEEQHKNPAIKEFANKFAEKKKAAIEKQIADLRAQGKIFEEGQSPQSLANGEYYLEERFNSHENTNEMIIHYKSKNGVVSEENLNLKQEPRTAIPNYINLIEGK